MISERSFQAKLPKISLKSGMNDKEPSLAFPQNSIFEMHVCEMEKQTEDCAIDEEVGVVSHPIGINP